MGVSEYSNEEGFWSSVIWCCVVGCVFWHWEPPSQRHSEISQNTSTLRSSDV